MAAHNEHFHRLSFQSNRPYTLSFITHPPYSHHAQCLRINDEEEACTAEAGLYVNSTP